MYFPSSTGCDGWYVCCLSWTKKTKKNCNNNFPDINFEDAYGEIKFNSNIYEINTEIIFEDFVSSSTSKIIYEGNNNGFIISRIYNGI